MFSPGYPVMKRFSNINELHFFVDLSAEKNKMNFPPLELHQFIYGNKQTEFSEDLAVRTFTIAPQRKLGKVIIVMTKAPVGLSGTGSRSGHLSYAGTCLVAVRDVDKNH